MVFAALLEYATVGYMGKRIAMRKTRTQQILKILNEHREKCIIAAAATAANNEAKDGNGRNNSVGGTSALVRTASLYPGMERTDLEEGLQLHKRVSLTIFVFNCMIKTFILYFYYSRTTFDQVQQAAVTRATNHRRATVRRAQVEHSNGHPH